MRTDDLLIKLQKNIRINLSQKHLINLCTYFNLPISGRKNQIQEKLINFLNSQNYETLKSMSNKADEYLIMSSSTKPRNTTTLNRTSIKVVPEMLTEFKLQTAPINLLDEVPSNLRTDLSNPIITPQMELSTTFPIKPTKNPFFDLPNVIVNKQVSTSPFYCCPVCLQPLTLLISLKSQNLTSNEKSDQIINFIITENVKSILSNNRYKLNEKFEHKWQVLMRFVGVDLNQSREVLNSHEQIAENIPPHLNLVINEITQPLWEMLPSNTRTKEGRRHPKPIQITDKLKLSSRNASGGYKQSVKIQWWQTPEVFTYYYVGIYLERKITVREMMTLYAPNSLFNNRQIDEILAWVQHKLGKVPNSSQNDDDGDDLVISNVLPINLNCPVSKSRIGVPVRTIHCEHLQCFDAVFFLSMNERRSVWKCPICDEQATPNELFTDKFFLSILQHFKNDDEVSDVNVNPDNSFVAVKQNRDRDHLENPIPKTEISVTNQASTQLTQGLIVLDSDDEDDIVPTKQKSVVKKQVEIQQSNQLTTGLPKLVSAPTPPPPKQIHTQPKATTSSVQKSTHVNKSIVPPMPPPYATPLSASKPVESNLQKESTPRVQTTLTNNIVTPSTKYSQLIVNQTDRRIQSNATESGTTTQSNNNSTANIFSSVTPISSIASPISSSTTATNGILLPSVVTNSPVSFSSFPSQLFTGTPASSFMTCAITSTGALIGSSTVSNSILNSNLSKSVSASIPSVFGNPISVISNRSIVDKQPQPNPIVSSRKSPITPSVGNTNEIQTPKEFISSRSIISPISTIAGIQSRNSTSKFRSDVQVTSGNRSPSPNIITELQTKDIVDIVRTLPVISIPAMSTRKRTSGSNSPEPIICPNVMVHQPDKKDKDSKNDTQTKTPDSPDQIKKSDNQKRFKTYQSKIPPPSSNVTIPSLTIDLTEEDDEEQQLPVNIKPAVPLVPKSMTWVPVSGPISNNLNKMINGINVNKYPQNHLNRCASNNRNIENEKRKLAELGIGHYKPHQMLHSNANLKPSKAHIDLTADDDDEDQIPNKRQKFNNSDNAAAVAVVDSNNLADQEDGQINDNESTNSNNSTNVNNTFGKSAPKNALHVVSKRKL